MADGIFGTTPGQVQQALAAERLGQAQIFGTLNASGRGALVGSLFGSAFGEDPRLRQARDLQAISQDMAARGLTPGTPEYTKAIVPAIQAKLGTQAALEAHKMALAAEERQIKIQGLRGPATSRSGLVKALTKRVGMDPDVAIEFAVNHPEISAKMVSERIKMTPDEKNALIAARGDPEKQADIIHQKMVKPLIQQNIGAEGAKVTARLRAAQAEEATEVARAAASLSDFAGTLEPGSIISPTARNQYNFRVRRVAKAIAQLRNPGSAEASQAAEEAIVQQMPSVNQASLFPAMVNEILQAVQAEARQSGTQPSPGDLSASDLRNMSDAELDALERQLSQ